MRAFSSEGVWVTWGLDAILRQYFYTTIVLKSIIQYDLLQVAEEECPLIDIAGEIVPPIHYHNSIKILQALEDSPFGQYIVPTSKYLV